MCVCVGASAPSRPCGCIRLDRSDALWSSGRFRAACLPMPLSMPFTALETARARAGLPHQGHRLSEARALGRGTPRPRGSAEASAAAPGAGRARARIRLLPSVGHPTSRACTPPTVAGVKMSVLSVRSRSGGLATAGQMWSFGDSPRNRRPRLRFGRGHASSAGRSGDSPFALRSHPGRSEASPPAPPMMGV